MTTSRKRPWSGEINTHELHLKKEIVNCCHVLLLYQHRGPGITIVVLMIMCYRSITVGLPLDYRYITIKFPSNYRWIIGELPSGYGSVSRDSLIY